MGEQPQHKESGIPYTEAAQTVQQAEEASASQQENPPLSPQKSTRWERLARGISWLLHPFFIPLYLMVVLLFSHTLFALYPLGIKIYLLWVVGLFTLLLPLFSLFVLRSLGRLSDWRVDQRHERILPLALGFIFYLLCAMTIAKIPSALLLRKMMLGAAGCELLCLVVSLRWKISLHLTAMGGALALLVLLSVGGVGNLMIPLLTAVAGCGLLASSRLYLGCHNGMQILCGFTGGFLIMSAAILLF